MASWYRFFLDFGRFWEASWEGNRSQDRPKKASKNDAKKKSNEIAKKTQQESPTTRDRPGLGSWGGSLLTRRVNSPRGCADRAFEVFGMFRGFGCWIIFKMDFSSFYTFTDV